MSPSKSILLIFVLLSVSHLPGLSQPGSTPSSLYHEGKALAKANPKKAYSKFTEALTLSIQSKESELHVKNVNALATLAFKGTGDLKQVSSWAKEAMKISMDDVADTLLAELHYNVAEFFYRDEEIDSAISHYKSAIIVWTSEVGEWNRQVANCYHGLGDIYKYNKFDFQEAEKSYEKALLIREKIQLQDTIVLYKNYYSLAATNRSQDDFEKAVSYGSKSLELARQLNDISRIEMCNGMVANIYRDMNETALAKKYYLEAIALNKKTGDLENRAWYYLSLGVLLRKEGTLLERDSFSAFSRDSLYNEALKKFSTAYTIYKTNGKDRLLFIDLLPHMIKTYALLHDDKNFFRTVKEFFGEIAQDKSRKQEAYRVYLDLGDFHSRKNRFDSALYYYQKALISAVPPFQSLRPEDNPSENMIRSDYYISEGLTKKAAALKARFSDTKNATYLQQAIESLMLAEKLVSLERNALDMEKAKWEFLEKNYDLYEDVISNLYDGLKVLPPDSLYNRAFHYFEQSKSRSLADALVQAERSKHISNKDSLFRIHGELRRKLSEAQRLVNQAVEKNEGSAEIPGLREKVVLLDRSIQVCKQAIEERYPGYFNVKYGYKTPGLQDIQKLIQKRHQVLLEYFWGPEWVYALGISGEDILLKRIGRPDSIEAIVNNLLLHLGDEHSSMNLEVFLQFTTHAHRLYEILVEPFALILAGKQRIQILPDGPISQIPFEILVEKSTESRQVNYRSLKYLIRSYAIGYAYSSSMLSNKTRGAIRRPTLLAVGFTGGQRLRSDPELEEIQGAEKELESLARRFNGGKFLVGSEATEANFKALSPGYDIIHLAVHGKGDVQRNFSSSLFFRSKYDSLDDGELHAYELYGLKLKAMMAVLSACESGLGKGYKGEGMISMASAFTYSGCENILMSLWKVNDQASMALMDDFYGELLQGETIDDALRQAKLRYLEEADELTADPKIWAPLVAYGNLDQVFQKDKSNIFYISLGAIVIMLLIYIVNKRLKSST